MPRRKATDPEAFAIGKRLRQLREEAGLGLEELAHAAEFSKGHLSNLERGFVRPTVSTLKVLADALGVLVADIVSDPEGSDREKLLELTRYASRGVLRRLVKDLSVAKSARRRG